MLHQATFLSYDRLWMAWISVNKQDGAKFKIPAGWLVRTTGLWANLFSGCATMESIAASLRCLDETSDQDFANFCRWIHGKRIAAP